MKEFRATTLLSKAQLIGQLNPQAWDAIHPHSPFVFADAHVELLTADLVRQISAALPDAGLRERVFGLSQAMARSAASGLVSSWEPGDEICPPWPFPWPFPRVQDWFRDIEQAFKPQPVPWQPIAAAETVQLAHLLSHAAGLTSDATFSRSLLEVATAVAASAARTLVDEFEKCGTKPRPKFPKKAWVRETQPA